jgi:hypothetical protein
MKQSVTGLSDDGEKTMARRRWKTHKVKWVEFFFSRLMPVAIGLRKVRTLDKRDELLRAYLDDAARKDHILGPLLRQVFWHQSVIQYVKGQATAKLPTKIALPFRSAREVDRLSSDSANALGFSPGGDMVLTPRKGPLPRRSKAWTASDQALLPRMVRVVIVENLHQYRLLNNIRSNSSPSSSVVGTAACRSSRRSEELVQTFFSRPHPVDVLICSTKKAVFLVI